MVPIRLLFRSRWWALLWSAGILWTAIDMAGDGKDTGNAAGAADLQEIANTLDGL